MTQGGDWGEFDGALQDDAEKFRRYRERDGDIEMTPPALMEVVLLAAAGVIGVAWMASMFWVPEVMSGTTWMALGALGMLVTALPGGALYWLRRGGAREIQRILRLYLG